MSSTKASTKPRIQRLRASCDGCFLAKVKCSKARPICSRCLTCGTDCKYSPSSRAGKPKANRTTANSSMKLNLATSDMTMESALSSPFFFDSNAITMAADGKNMPIFTFDTNWSVTSGSTDDSFPASLSTNVTPPLESNAMLDAEMGLPSSTSEIFEPSFMWTQTVPTDIGNGFYLEPPMMLPRSKSVGDATRLDSFSPWLETQQSTHFSLPTGRNSSSPNNLESPCSSPDFLDSSRAPVSTSCNCLKTCLQSLLALDDNSNSTKAQPAFDVVLTINRKAVEACASMLACHNCAARSGSNTNTMLLAIIMEKILSFYQDATRSYFGSTPGTGSQMSIGTYQVTNEVGCWLKAEILWRELRKLEELLGHFRNVNGSHGGVEDTGVCSSLVNHLSQTLTFTFEIMKLQQTGFNSLQ